MALLDDILPAAARTVMETIGFTATFTSPEGGKTVDPMTGAVTLPTQTSVVVECSPPYSNVRATGRDGFVGVDARMRLAIPGDNSQSFAPEEHMRVSVNGEIHAIDEIVRHASGSSIALYEVVLKQ